jgi:hypothetical protein
MKSSMTVLTLAMPALIQIMLDPRARPGLKHIGDPHEEAARFAPAPASNATRWWRASRLTDQEDADKSTSLAAFVPKSAGGWISVRATRRNKPRGFGLGGLTVVLR